MKTSNLISLLAWEPSAAKVTKIYSRRLPALVQFYQFFSIKVDPLVDPLVDQLVDPLVDPLNLES